MRGTGSMQSAARPTGASVSFLSLSSPAGGAYIEVGTARAPGNQESEAGLVWELDATSDDFEGFS